MKKTFAIKSLRGVVAALMMIGGMLFASSSLSAQTITPTHSTSSTLNVPTNGNLVDSQTALDRLISWVANRETIIANTSGNYTTQQVTVAQQQLTYYKETARNIMGGETVINSLYMGARSSSAVFNPTESLSNPATFNLVQQLLTDTYWMLN